jgi:hypothetical protein
MGIQIAPRLALAGLIGLAFGGVGCASKPTYYQDVQPIIQAKCEGCHNPTGIGPFPLETAAEVVAQKTLIRSVVSSKTMPPWPPSNACNTFANDRSLTDAEISTLTTWIDQGAVLGDASHQKTGTPDVGMSRVDFSMQMPEPFTPQITPDDYRCFLLDWAPTTAEYVTGLGVRPGDPHIVHHSIAYVAHPDQVAMYQALDGTDGSPGWTCFGGPDGTSTPNAAGGGFGSLSTQWLGAWAPGAVGMDFPADTGVLVEPGSKIILQLHYNTSNTPPAPDQTTLDIEVAPTVKKPAFVMPFTDPEWLKGKMSIPPNVADTMYSYSLDPTPDMNLLTQGLIPAAVPFTVYLSFLHMHTRGSSILGRIDKSDGTNQCLLDIPQWNFSWQGGYTFSQPIIFYPGEQLYLECHWNNTAANQPIVDGQQVTPHELNWGETTEDEMCLEILYRGCRLTAGLPPARLTQVRSRDGKTGRHSPLPSRAGHCRGGSGRPVLQDRFWERLMANVGIVLVFTAFYLRWLERP